MLDDRGSVFPDIILFRIESIYFNRPNHLITRPNTVPSKSREIVRMGARLPDLPVILPTSVRGWGITSSGSNSQLEEAESR